MLTIRTAAPGLCLVVLLAGNSPPQASPSEPTHVNQVGGSPALTNFKGLTLYTYDRDTAAKSFCKGVCAEKWPPLTSNVEAKPTSKYTIIKREDGSKQWVYGGKPLYRFFQDKKPGEAKGNGFGNRWHVARP
jgi:predicted lipoprotein with Yx(FWY)xxD motif